MVGAAVVDGAQLREIAEVVRPFGVGAPTDVRTVPEGLMNRNWHVTTTAGCTRSKQVQDAHVAQVRRLHAATIVLAARGLPVAAPVVTPGGGTVVEHGGSCWTLTPWIPVPIATGCICGWRSAARWGGCWPCCTRGSAR